jgi:1-deoxy-D-xylulose-5-phosphate synthase
MSDKLLTSINYLDLRLLDEAQLPQLAQELRNFIIDFCKEGHLASLGVIELIALHYVFNTQMIY